MGSGWDFCDQQVSSFLAQYEQLETQARFEKLTKLTREECETMLENMGIKCVVQDRAKRLGSLEKKLRDMALAEDFETWLFENKDLYRHLEMGDLAGVRTGLFLPDHIGLVAIEIQKHFVVKHLFGTVTGGREASQNRNLDATKHGDGPWRSQDSAGSEENWQHYGYRSWQVVVEWKTPPPIKGLESSRIEIQVGTVVTQAWAEVQHNIIYKKSTDIMSTPTMTRMIDAINGLAITTEIMLRELDRSMAQAKEEARALSLTPFKNGQEFSNWFRSAYLSNMGPMERQRWIHPPRWAHTVAYGGASEAHNEGWVEYRYFQVPPTRLSYGRLIEKYGLLKSDAKGVGKLDISELLIGAMGFDVVKEARGWSVKGKYDLGPEDDAAAVAKRDAMTELDYEPFDPTTFNCRSIP